ncbi:MAG: hypothetical protein K0B81_06625 [Candidatus Cloacimonetes bacterium]|nr:hypothetical protein [Candidatus Cloacimonadota bacterium]
MLHGRKSTPQNLAKKKRNCRITFRLNENTVSDFKKIAQAKHISLDNLGREAVDDFLKKNLGFIKRSLSKM